MNYPQELLPQPGLKLIDCSIEEQYLLRFVQNQDDILDPDTGKIKVEQICHPSEQIYDLSLVLLGVYNDKHIPIELTKVGKQNYAGYCAPDSEIVPSPTFNTDFVINDDRRFWVCRASDLVNKPAMYNRNNVAHTATSYIKHTPARWNFWHYSLLWQSSEGDLDTFDEKERGKVVQKLKHAARTAISNLNATINFPETTPLPPNCFRAVAAN